jgi:hypothetical protein
MISKFKEWFKDKRSMAYLLMGIALLSVSILNGESFVGHIPLACVLIIAGVLTSNRN